MQSTKIKKATFKHIEAELYSYHDTKKEIARLREEIMYDTQQADENIGGNRTLEVGRPTERIATRLLTHKTLRNLEEITEAIESVYNSLEKEQQDIVNMRYWAKPSKDWGYIADMCCMGRRTAFNYRAMIVMTIAEKIGWR